MTRRALITGITGQGRCYAGLDWHEFVQGDEAYLRATEVDALIHATSTAGLPLGSATAEGRKLVRIMIDAPDSPQLEHEGRRGIARPALAGWSVG
jgi:GDP-D-mannose dehydratase